MAVEINGTTGVKVPPGASADSVPQAQETVLKVNGAARLPNWTTAGRPATPGIGDEGINTTLNCKEYWNGMYWIPDRIMTGDAIATTSGTYHDVLNIPAGIKKLTIHFFGGVGHNGTDGMRIQLGTSAGVFNSASYIRVNFRTAAGAIAGSGSSTNTGFDDARNQATEWLYGKAVLELVNSATNTWTLTWDVGTVNATAQVIATRGEVTLPNMLDRIRLTSPTGTSVFNHGSISPTWEF